MNVVGKVVAYVTRGNDLLVFRHVHVPDAGIQVPAGTLEPGESPYDGILREAREETGLDGLRVRSFLGTLDYDMSSFGKSEVHRRHYYHLEYEGDTPSTWRVFENPGPEPIEFELFWVGLPDGVPELHANLGDFLEELDLSG